MAIVISAARAPFLNRQTGLSIIELMIGVAVGLIVTLAVISTVSLINQQRRDTVSGNDAKESAQLALSLLNDAGRQAGAGLFYNGQMICKNINIYKNGVTFANGASLMPARITDGGATGSDSITFTYAAPGAGTAGGGSSLSVLVGNMASSSAEFLVNTPGTLQAGELALIGVPGDDITPCTLFQVSGFSAVSASCNSISSTCQGIQHVVSASFPYNAPASTFTTEPRYGYQAAAPVVGPAVISKMDAFVQDTYGVMCDTLVAYSSLAPAGSCSNTSSLTFTGVTPMVGDVVQVQAQYGITSSAGSDVITSWEDASGGTWTAPSATDIPRIKAVRVAVIARSKESAPNAVSQACTNAASVANTGPCTFEDAEAPVVNLSASSVPSGKTWQNYRYRVYKTIIPLRNVAWNY